MECGLTTSSMHSGTDHRRGGHLCSRVWVGVVSRVCKGIPRDLYKGLKGYCVKMHCETWAMVRGLRVLKLFLRPELFSICASRSCSDFLTAGQLFILHVIVPYYMLLYHITYYCAILHVIIPYCVIFAASEGKSKQEKKGNLDPDSGRLIS